MIVRTLKIVRNVTFLLWFSASLAFSAIGLGLWAMNLSLKVATMTASAASTTVRHRRQIAKAISREKAKGRLRRMMIAVPVLGSGVAVSFEAYEYYQWQEENPEGTLTDYSCEVSEITAEVMDEVLQELPELIRPSPERVSSLVPECENEE